MFVLYSGKFSEELIFRNFQNLVHFQKCNLAPTLNIAVDNITLQCKIVCNEERTWSTMELIQFFLTTAYKLSLPHCSTFPMLASCPNFFVHDGSNSAVACPW